MKHRVVTGVFFLAVSLCFGFNGIKAQQRMITLQEAIDLSIKNSKQLKGSSARIEEATAALKQAVEAKLPNASATGSYLRLNNPNVNLKLKTAPPDNSGNSSGPAGSAHISQAMYGLVNISLPIYAGGRIRYGIESSKYLEEAAKLDAENDKESVILNTINAFNNLFKAKAAVAIVDSSLAEAKQRVRDYTNMEKNGILARNDLLKAQLQESNTELSLLDAQNNWKLANINMNLMLGLPDSTELIADTTSMIVGSDTRTITDFVQLAFQNRKDLSALDYRKKAAETGVKATRAESYPSLALTGGYAALNIPNALTVYNAVNIGLGLQFNIASLWKNGKIEQARARAKEAEAGKEELYDAIRLQVSQAYENYILSQKKIDVFNTAIAQAEENYNVNLNKFNNGLATVTDVLDADVARLQARLNLASAKTDSYAAYSRLLETAGVLNNTANQIK